MAKSILFAVPLVVALAGCAQFTALRPAPPPPADGPAAFVPGFTPYCGPTWSVDKQGYVDIPCPGGITPQIIR